MNEQRLDQNPSAKTAVGLRAIALLEAAKGAIALLLGCGALDLIHKNLHNVAARLAEVLHASPDGKLSQLFAKLATHATDRSLRMLALGALIYAAVRLIAAYGLWRVRAWAQWFELVFTALYLPPELYWLLRHPSWIKCGVLVTNLAILLYMLTLRVAAVRPRSQEEESLQKPNVEISAESRQYRYLRSMAGKMREIDTKDKENASGEQSWSE